jgi:hypothetical protein
MTLFLPGAALMLHLGPSSPAMQLFYVVLDGTD